jgi:single-stranded DNA-specific DHH superfamily exonuclease
MTLQSTDPSSVAVLCGAGAVFLLLLARLVRYFVEPAIYIEPVQSLITPAEQKFYEALDEAIDGRLMILSKVRVADLFSVTSESGPARQRIFRSIACKHVDFLLAEPQNLRPLAAIELDDATHRRSDRQKRDELLDDLFEKAELPLLRFKTASAYSPRSIEVQVKEAIGETWKI